MSIVRKTTFTRPNTSVPFTTYTDTVIAEIDAILQPAIDQGKLTVQRVNSDDLLTREKVFTCTDLETLSLTFNSVTVAQQVGYYNSRPAEVLATTSITGIDQPFSVTTVYTSPEGTPITTDLDLSTYQFPSTYFGSTRDLQICIELHDSKITNLSTTTNTITVVHQYNNADDYNANFWNDNYLLTALNKLSITKNVQFQLV
jgi:hypothetical protein